MEERQTLDALGPGPAREVSLRLAMISLQRAWAASFEGLGGFDLSDALPDRKLLPHPIQAAWRVHCTRSDARAALLRINAGGRDWYAVVSVKLATVLIFSRSGALSAAGRMKVTGYIEWSPDPVPHHWF